MWINTKLSTEAKMMLGFSPETVEISVTDNTFHSNTHYSHKWNTASSFDSLLTQVNSTMTIPRHTEDSSYSSEIGKSGVL